MNGRVENDLNIYEKIEKELVNYPDFVVSWYYYFKANDKTATSCRDYLNKIRGFLEFINKDIESVKIEDFNENIITEYFIKIKYKDNNTETSYSYRQSIWSCLNNFFAFLNKRGMINENYFIKAGIERPKGNDIDKINEKRILLTKRDFQKILQAIDEGVGSQKARTYQKNYNNRDKAIMLLLMTTGMRKTALLEINVNDIDFEKKEIYIIDKKYKYHTYILNDELINVLQKWKVDRYFILGGKDIEPLFISRDGKRMCGNSLDKLIDKYSYAALGYHISPHKFRSGLASIMYDETRDIEFVRRVIGHSKVTTTQRYIVTDNSEREKASKIISDAII